MRLSDLNVVAVLIWFPSVPLSWWFIDHLQRVIPRHQISLLQIPIHKALCS